MFKIYLSLAFAIGVMLNANAQMQLSIQGGPKVSYTNSFGASRWGSRQVVMAKSAWQGGIYVNYRLPSKKISLETGIGITRQDIVFSIFPKLKGVPDFPEVFLAYSALQIPLRIKMDILPNASRWALRPVLGLLYTAKIMDALRPKTPFSGHADRFGYYTLNDGYGPINLSSPFNSGFDNMSSFLSIEGGVETGFKLNSQIEIIGSIIYQNGLSSMDAYIMYIKYPNENQDPEEFVTATSRGEALNFNVGVGYTFGKSNN